MSEPKYTVRDTVNGKHTEPEDTSLDYRDRYQRGMAETERKIHQIERQAAIEQAEYERKQKAGK